MRQMALRTVERLTPSAWAVCAYHRPRQNFLSNSVSLQEIGNECAVRITAGLGVRN